ncbi:MAG: MaoC family dehydratase N-terminal domain-containing protein [Bryobacteraceae bacterium]
MKDVITAWPLSALAATLDRGVPGDVVPPLWHWLYFLPTYPQSALAPDGHVHRGGFLPPVELPRRMWAGGRLEFHDSLRVGDTATRTSTIASVVEKHGRTGPLVFVVVRHEIHTARGFALAEEHDIVYRDHPQPGEVAVEQLAPSESEWERTVHPDDVLLFRYSAATFNGHRIHYDRRYCTDVEHYPGLVVHGPLVATMMLELAREHMAGEVTRFSFRAVSPLFDTQAFVVRGSREGNVANLNACATGGRLAMTASAEFSAPR